MARSNGAQAAESSRRAAAGLLQEARDVLPDLAKEAERVLQERADRLKVQSREAAAIAGEQLETARTYVVERVQERPFTTTLAVLGAGFLIGMLFAGRRR